jgi:hypothetical protein
VEGFWSPALYVHRENRRLKQQIFDPLFFLRAGAEDLSLSGGASLFG